MMINNNPTDSSTITRVLIVGGYGNFGGFISRALAKEVAIQLIIAGRSLTKAEAFCRQLADECYQLPEAAALDICVDCTADLAALRPDLVIHTSGPFQAQSYAVAQACIKIGAHYVDLADGREFVRQIHQLDNSARERGVLVVSGASSVPCLTAALVDHYLPDFGQLDNLDYGISTAQQSQRGLATTAAILSYTGKAFTTIIKGKTTTIHGWQGLHWRRFRRLGKRPLSYCNIPDLALFPTRYPSIQSIRFYAGLELSIIHVALWGLSWLVRAKLIRNVSAAAPLLLKLSNWFDRFGSDRSGFFLSLSGKDHQGKAKAVNFELTAESGDGVYIPCIPAILLTRQLVDGSLNQRGAMPCLGLISRDDYLCALAQLCIFWEETYGE